ncbi:MAG: thiamine phosphate synthase, partial [Bradyrhizobium sp.]|nr:thiamine phosphate synthase [Bradyrhizobium sp.]
MSDKTAPARPAPRLYLATQMVTDPAPLAASLPAILGSADVAAVLVR